MCSRWIVAAALLLRLASSSKTNVPATREHLASILHPQSFLSRQFSDTLELIDFRGCHGVSGPWSS